MFVKFHCMHIGELALMLDILSLGLGFEILELT